MFRYFLHILGYFFRGRHRKWSSRRASKSKRVSKKAENEPAKEPPQRRRSILDLIRIIFAMKPLGAGNKKGIVYDETSMFGKLVEEHVNEHGVSLFVFWCVNAIEAKGERLRTDALYRSSGNLKSVELIAGTEKEKMCETLEVEQNIHVLTGALKKFLGCLQEPLLCTENFKFEIENESENKRIKVLKYVHALNSCMKHEAMSTFQFFMVHLLRVAECHNTNRMNIEALAHTVGPSLVRSQHDDSTDTKHQIHVTQFILENFQEITDCLPRQQDQNSTMRRLSQKFDMRKDFPKEASSIHNDEGVQGTFVQFSDKDTPETSLATSADQRRPSEVVVRDPMFGGFLKDYVDKATGASQFVVWCVEAIEITGDNFKTDALYRASGNQTKVQEISVTERSDMQEKLANEANVNVLTGALKLFFRQLKEPLLDHIKFEEVIQNAQHDNRDACLEARKLTKDLGDVEWATLKYVMKHLKTVLDHSEWNNMSVEGMGVVFGPTLMSMPDDSVDMAGDMRQRNRIVEFFLNNYEVIFT